MLNKQNSKYDQQLLEYKVVESYFEQNINEDSEQYRFRKMAVEIILSFINDILTIPKLRKFCNIIADENIPNYKKTFAQLMIDRHVNALNWFCDKDVEHSIWFEILGWRVDRNRMMNIVHERIENYE